MTLAKLKEEFEALEPFLRKHEAGGFDDYVDEHLNLQGAIVHAWNLAAGLHALLPLLEADMRELEASDPRDAEGGAA